MPAEPLSRPRIVAAAIGLIEREGADAVSMRRIAGDLGVSVMSLYNHVPNKSTLLDAVAEPCSPRSSSPTTRTPNGPIASAYRRSPSGRSRTTIPGARGGGRRQLKSNAGLLPVERALTTLRGAGFDGHDAVRILRTFIAYIVGSLLREVGVTPTFAPHHRRDLAVKDVDPLLFPEVSGLASALSDCDHQAEFEFGLELLIEAITVRLKRRRPGPARSRASPGNVAFPWKLPVVSVPVTGLEVTPCAAR